MVVNVVSIPYSCNHYIQKYLNENLLAIRTVTSDETSGSESTTRLNRYIPLSLSLTFFITKVAGFSILTPILTPVTHNTMLMQHVAIIFRNILSVYLRGDFFVCYVTRAQNYYFMFLNRQMHLKRLLTL